MNPNFDHFATKLISAIEALTKQVAAIDKRLADLVRQQQGPKE